MYTVGMIFLFIGLMAFAAGLKLLDENSKSRKKRSNHNVGIAMVIAVVGIALGLSITSMDPQPKNTYSNSVSISADTDKPLQIICNGKTHNIDGTKNKVTIDCNK